MKQTARFLLSVSLIFLVGCAVAPTHLTIQPGFWQGKKGTIGIALVKVGEPGVYYGGRQGLLDLLINEAGKSGIRDAMKTLDVAAFSKIKNVFSTEIRQTKGWDAIVVDDEIDLAGFAEVDDAANKGLFPLDIRQLKERLGIDYLLLFNVLGYGGFQLKFGFISTSDLHAFVQMRGDLIDLSDGRNLWVSEMELENSITPLEGKWNTDKEYAQLKKAFNKSVDNAIRYMRIEFNGGFK